MWSDATCSIPRVSHLSGRCCACGHACKCGGGCGRGMWPWTWLVEVDVPRGRVHICPVCSQAHSPACSQAHESCWMSADLSDRMMRKVLDICRQVGVQRFDVHSPASAHVYTIQLQAFEWGGCTCSYLPPLDLLVFW